MHSDIEHTIRTNERISIGHDFCAVALGLQAKFISRLGCLTEHCRDSRNNDYYSDDAKFIYDDNDENRIYFHLLWICWTTSRAKCKTSWQHVGLRYGQILPLFTEPISELRSVTCHIKSHSFTCHPTQVNVHRLNLSQTDRYSIDLSWKDSRL